MKVVIQDANLLIDLELAGLIEHWFRLGIESWTTDIILAQLSTARQPFVHQLVKEGLLRVLSADGLSVEQMFALKDQVNRGLDLEDVSALFWAMRKGAILLTGDKLLVKEARERGIIVHGTLWVMDTLVERQIIHPRKAAEGLNLLIKEQRRLPMEECRKRLVLWI